jgi:hypothetical protein
LSLAREEKISPSQASTLTGAELADLLAREGVLAGGVRAVAIGPEGRLATIGGYEEPDSAPRAGVDLR